MESPKPNSFACPGCATRLRVGSKLFEQKQIACPECSTELLVSQSEEGVFAEINLPAGAATPNPIASLLKRLLDSPRRTQWIAGGITIVLALAIVVVVISGGPEVNDAIVTHPTNTGQPILRQADTANGDKRVAQIENAVAPNSANDVANGLPDQAVDPKLQTPANQTPVTIEPPVDNVADKNATKSDDDGTVANTGTDNSPDTTSKGATSPSSDPNKNPIQQVANVDPLNPTEPTVKTAKIEQVEPIVPEKPKTLAQRLAQPLASFKHSKPVALSQVVEVVEELVQARITFADSVAAELREHPVALDLTKTTPREIIEQAAARAKLQVVVDQQSVRLEPAE
jgi:hypothetical protein